MPFAGKTRKHNILCCIFHIGLFCIRNAWFFRDRFSGMGKSCGCMQDYRCIVLLTVFKCFFHKCFCLTAVCGLQHRYLRRFCNTARILFILRTVNSRIICRYQHQSSIYSHIGCRVKRVTGDIDSDLLHGGHGTHARKGCTNCRFQCGLFIGRPLAVYFTILCKTFVNLCTRCSRICCGYLYTGFVRTSGNRFVSKH